MLWHKQHKHPPRVVSHPDTSGIWGEQRGKTEIRKTRRAQTFYSQRERADRKCAEKFPGLLVLLPPSVYPLCVPDSAPPSALSPEPHQSPESQTRLWSSSGIPNISLTDLSPQTELYLLSVHFSVNVLNVKLNLLAGRVKPGWNEQQSSTKFRQ